ncbi:hypothetical protein QBC42DRAFT_343948 [Cladorrhinum samala]|uniref:Uncharacterized protein n=1 Tax=Cladorrhinum samala TaxID=585594 RepID=A0AAV9I1S4_9PEZI|nr:hypothetical protein QBC42DRAFT_343948 [Cladorrhinum samala]
MLLKALLPLPLLIRSAKGWGERSQQAHRSPVVKDVCTADTTLYNTTTVQVTHYVDFTVNITTTQVFTECKTTTLHYTTAVTETETDSVTITNTAIDSVTITNTGTDLVTVTNTDTDSVTVTNTDTDSVTITNTETDSVTVTNTDTDSVTITNTETDLATVTNTETDSTTITNTETDSVTVTNTDTDSITITETDSATITNTATTTTTVPATITTWTTQTIFSTTYDPCPKSCSISAETVNLYFWPTNRPYTYPTTYVDTKLGYTFTSPSVYMYIPTAVGINTLNQTVGPSTASWILPLDLYEVSTIASGSITRQLTLADLGTDCPQTADPTAIATMVDSRCDPVLAAPTQVRSWAYPCNACGRFGLFDPPYAVPTLTGSLVEPPRTTTIATTVVTIPPPVIVTATPAPVTSSPGPVVSGVVVVEYFDTDGNLLSSSVLPTTGVTGTVTSSVTVFPLPTFTTRSGSEAVVVVPPTPTTPVATGPDGTTGGLPATSGLPATTSVATAAGNKQVAAGEWWLVLSAVTGAVVLFY